MDWRLIPATVCIDPITIFINSIERLFFRGGYKLSLFAWKHIGGFTNTLLPLLSVKKPITNK